MTKYLIRTKEGNGEEIGYVFIEAEGFVLPPGYIAYTDEVTCLNDQVGHEDEFAHISKAQYDHIVEHLIRGFDPTEAIQEVLQSLGNVQALFDNWQAFKRAAVELSRAWEHVPHELEETIGIDKNYPFEQDFMEIVAKIQNWGIDDE